MKGRSPTAEEKRFMQKVAESGCLICWIYEGVYSPAEIHHIEGKTKEGAHKKILPLCYLHHREGSNTLGYVSRHPHRAEFEARYGTEADLYEKLKERIE